MLWNIELLKNLIYVLIVLLLLSIAFGNIFGSVISAITLAYMFHELRMQPSRYEKAIADIKKMHENS